ncbi:hypothetical protein [Microbacterium sp.]|uniref:hypothetical protein n=1 Tax=Microbacterium sp. TaxID=51671 RepID=UPI0037CC72E6
MAAQRAFRNVTREEVAWRLELGKDDPDYVELMWLDAELEGGWQVGIGWYRSRPHDGGRPAITVNLLRPGHGFVEVHETFEPADFEPGEFGGRWGQNELVGRLDDAGRPLSFRLSVAIGDIAISLDAEVVAPGVKFTTAVPGFSHFRPDSGTAIGWWPLAPRADATGEITVDGQTVAVRGRIHLEKQLSSLPLAGAAGAASAQSIWTWGHFSAGDYTGIWTDSAASAQLGYRHFTPFVLYKGGDPVMSTFAFASAVERFTVDADSGLPRPVVVTIRAVDGEREFFARLLDGRVSDQFELNGQRGAFYCRQVSRCEGELRHWGATTRMEGSAVHEWGTQAGNFPFAPA